MIKLLFYPCDARKHISGKVFFRFRDLSERIYMSENMENAYQEIADILKMLVLGKIICGESIPAPSSRLEHEFVVEVPATNMTNSEIHLISENYPTASNRQI